MMLGISVIQLLLFGYAINTNPRELPTAVIAADHGVEARAFLAALTNTGYFRITHRPAGPAEMDRLLASGAVQFGVEIPSGFGRDLLRGGRPSLQLGRASCRERVCQYVEVSLVAGSLKKKKK